MRCVGVLTIEVGGLTETVQVTSEAALVNTQSGERSFTITTESVENLPIANRSFTALASLAPGVTGTTRIGGGGGNNIMMDGVSAVDTGSNAILLQMNVESIAEVKVLVSGYQAEYGRSSGLQITAVTKSGTNRFRGSAYGVFRDSDWYSNSRTNILNGDPKTVLQEKDLGLLDRRPDRQAGRQEQALLLLQPRVRAAHRRERRPCATGCRRALERAGDFSQTIDNNGALYPYIRDPQLSRRVLGRRTRPPASRTAACSAASRPTGSTTRA